MTTGGKPPSGSSPDHAGRPAADTPQRVVVRSLNPSSDATVGAGDTAMGAGDTAMGATDAAPARPSMRTTTTSAGYQHLADIVGTTLSGRYLVTRQVGQGGMGAVYEATHTLIGKRVAVKVLLEKYTRREAIVQRLEQEARLASSVNNEHIIDITDFGKTEDGRTFVVMEFLDGESLAEALAREPKLPEQRILRIISQACSALAAAHAKGVVHRDIKPENLFLLKRKDQDFVKVVDFGISKSLRQSAEEEEQPRLTQTGMVLGTPLYMSPEQARGDDELDHRVDIYALGVIMYEAAAGRVPFIGNNYLSVISQVLNESPPPLREMRPELSEEFEAIVTRAMAKDRDDRYADANEMHADVSALLDDPTRSTERARITGPRRKAPAKKPAKGGTKVAIWAASVATVVIAIVVVVTQTMGHTPPKPPTPGSGSPLVVTPPPADAAIVVDAADPLMEVTIISDPPNAEIFKEGVSKGFTPLVVRVIKNVDAQYTAQLPGYDDKQFGFNPLEIQDTRTVKVTLKKPPKGIAPTHIKPAVVKPGDGSGSDHPPDDKTGGDLTGDPFHKKSNVPKP